MNHPAPRESSAGLHVGVVAYEMEGRATGVGRYLEGMLGGVAQLGGNDRFSLFFKGDGFSHRLWGEAAADATQAKSADGRFRAFFDRRPSARPIFWEQLILPRLMRGMALDLLYSPAYSLPPTSLPGVVTLHDLSFEHLPQEFPFKERWRRRFLARQAARRAQRVLVPSQAIVEDLRATYGVPVERIGLVPEAVDEVFSPSPPGQAAVEAARLGELGVRAPYLLFAGSALPRRRLDLVLPAFAALLPRYPRLRLVIAGQDRLPQRGGLGRLIGESAVARQVERLGWVEEADLPLLYRHAELSFYLSTYEGFGLPPLESLACGTAPVVSSGLAFDELWPEYPYRSALDAAAVKQVLGQALEDPEARQQIAEEGRRRVGELSWRASAELFLDHLREAAG